MNMRKIVVFGLAFVLVVGSLGGIFVALVKDDDGNSSSASSTSSTASTTSTTRVEFTGTDSEAFCQADARLNQEVSQQAPTTTEPAALEAYFEKKVDAIKQLEAIAPAEVKADVTITIGAYEAFRPVLAAVGWDQSKVSAEQAAAVQTPAVTAAGQRLSQYTERVCKLVPQG
jgi:cytoskeletal protein RodZ